MIHPAIKSYLHSTAITKKEVELIKELLKDSKETLKDFLPKEKYIGTYFLGDLLRVSLKDHKNNEQFIKEILSLKNKDNEKTLYYYLKESKYGLVLLRTNPSIHNNNINNVFFDTLSKSAMKDVLIFVKANKENINIDTVYKCKFDGLSLKLIQSLEKEGFSFDERILPVVNNSKNWNKPAPLLKYMEQFRDSVKEEDWNIEIIRMLRHFNKEFWDWNGKDRFKDSIFLVTKMRNPGQYKWGGPIIKDAHSAYNYDKFSFGNCVNEYLKENHLNDVYIDEKNVNNLKALRKFIKTNDIHFETIKNNESLFITFLDTLSTDVIEQAIKNSWKEMFQFKNKNKHMRREEVIVGDLFKDSPIMLNKRTRPFILREYFAQPKYRLGDFDEKYFFERLGINKTSIIKENVLKQYYDVLDLPDIKNIAEKFNLNKIEMEKELLEYKLPRNGTDKKEKKLKI